MTTLAQRRKRNTAPTRPRDTEAARTVCDAPLVDEGDEDEAVLVPLIAIADALNAVKFFGPLSTAFLTTGVSRSYFCLFVSNLQCEHHSHTAVTGLTAL